MANAINNSQSSLNSWIGAANSLLPSKPPEVLTRLSAGAIYLVSIQSTQANQLGNAIGALADGTSEFIDGALKVKNTAVNLWHMIRPYQPAVSAIGIVGKAGLKNWNLPQSRKKIKELTLAIGAAKSLIQKTKNDLEKTKVEIEKEQKTKEELNKELEKVQLELAISKIEKRELTDDEKILQRGQQIDAKINVLQTQIETKIPAQRAQIEKNIAKLLNEFETFKERLNANKSNLERLINDREKTNNNFTYAALSILQLPSLVFPHPGQNWWNSLINMGGRGFSLNQAFLKQSTKEIILGTIAELGTLSSFLQQTQIMHEDNIVGDALIFGAMLVHAVEFLTMAKNTVNNNAYCASLLSKLTNTLSQPGKLLNMKNHFFEKRNSERT